MGCLGGAWGLPGGCLGGAWGCLVGCLGDAGGAEWIWSVEEALGEGLPWWVGIDLWALSESGSGPQKRP